MKTRPRLSLVALAALLAGLVVSCANPSSPTTATADRSSMIYTCGIGSNGDYIAALAIDSNTGALKLENSVSEKSLTGGFRSLALSPDGKYLFALDFNKYIYVYAIDSSTGAITYVSQCPTHDHGMAIRLNAAGSLAFVVTSDGYLESFSVSGNAVTQVQSLSLSSSGSIMSVAVDSMHGYVYAVHHATDGSGRIYPVAYDSTGALAAATTIITGNAPNYVTVDTTATYLYAAVNDSIYTYTIGSSGALTYKAKATDSSSCILCPMSIAFAPSGKYAYAIDLFGQVDECTLSDGELAVFGSAATVANSNPQSIALDSAGKYVYVADRDTSFIQRFSVSPSDGSLTSTDELLLDGALMDMAYLR